MKCEDGDSRLRLPPRNGCEESEDYLEGIVSQVAALASQHGLPCRPSRKLKSRYLDEFPSESVFDRIARAVCRVEKIPRKELFEAWAVAQLVYAHFWTRYTTNDGDKPRYGITRIADMVAGHGLLSWILLVLHHHQAWQRKHQNHHPLQQQQQQPKQHPTEQPTEHEDGEDPKSLPLSAVCIDARMPETADRLQEEMLSEFPELSLANQWDYVEGLLEGIQPSPETLILGIHACGSLSDKLIAKATLGGGCSLALVPCCHSKKCLTAEELLVLDKEASSAPLLSTSLPSSVRLSTFLDALRISRLQDSGWNVKETRIPDIITPKNRLLLADAPTAGIASGVPTSAMGISKKGCWWQTQWEWQRPTLCIPIGDTPVARTQVHNLAGRSAARARREPPAIRLGLRIVLPSLSPDNITGDSLQVLAESIMGDSSCVSLMDQTGPVPHHDAASGVYTRTFLVVYNRVFEKPTAQKWHQKVIDAIPVQFPGAYVLYNKPRPKPVVLDLHVYLPSEGDVQTDQVEKAVVALVNVPCQVHLKSTRQPYRDPSGKRLRIFRLHYTAEDVVGPINITKT